MGKRECQGNRVKIKNLIFHCSNSHYGDVETFRRWHTDPKPKGRGWRDIGYNAVILNGQRSSNKSKVHLEDGMIEQGRGLNLDAYIDGSERGAHTFGYNANSIGICLVGKKKFTMAQLISAVYFARFYIRIVPEIKIYGHYEKTRGGKTCPNIDMDKMRKVIEDENTQLYMSILDKLANNVMA